MTKLKEISDKRNGLLVELSDLGDRLKSSPDDAGLAQRRTNIQAALVKLEPAFAKAMTAAIAAGNFALESGDGAGGVDADRRLTRQFGSARSVGAKSSAMAEAILDQGFSLKSRPSVEVKAFDVLTKATTVPAVADWNRRAPDVVPMGQDARFLWPFLASEDAGMNASIQDFKQTARTLTGTVQRTLNATTDKANLATTTSLVNAPLVEFAVTLNDIPNAVLESVPAFTAYMASEGEFQVNKAIDDHVMAQIVAATPANGISGTNLITQARNAISAMRAVGANPTLAVLNPADSVTLDTYQAVDGTWIFPTVATNTATPLYGLTVVERIGLGDNSEEPWLIDPQMLGVLYLGSMRFDVDPYTGFKKNLSTLRVEIRGLYHVRNAQGAYEIVA